MCKDTGGGETEPNSPTSNFVLVRAEQVDGEPQRTVPMHSLFYFITDKSTGNLRHPIDGNGPSSVNS
jgi:hypothetical protein